MKDHTATEQATDRAELINAVGLHARPSVKLTQLAKTFDCRVEIALSADGPWVDAKSPVKVMRVKAPRGAVLHVRTSGNGRAGGGGCADGPRPRRLRRRDGSAGRSETWLSFACSAAAPRREWRKASWPFWTPQGGRSARPPARGRRRPWRLQRALSRALAEVEALAGKATGEAADMLGFQVAMLSDDELVRPALEGSRSRESPPPPPGKPRWMPKSPVTAPLGTIISRPARPISKTSATACSAIWTPGAASAVIPAGSVVVAADLPISRFLAIDWAQGGAIVLTQGSPTQPCRHAGAGSRRADGRGPRRRRRRHGRPRGPGRRGDGRSGARPNRGHPGRLCRQGAPRKDCERRERGVRARPAVTKDGTRIALNLNASSADELEGVDPAICDGIGLVRTELLFHGRAACRTRRRSTRPIAASSPGPRGGLSPYARWTPAATSRSRA